jgi:predicted XRE-type DNA-binding protein
MQEGRPVTLDVRPMQSIGRGVFELKTADDATWYRLIYLARIDNIIYVLDGFEKDTRKTENKDLDRAKGRFKKAGRGSWRSIRMPNKIRKANEPSHITRGSVFDDLGLSRVELIEAKVKADLWRDLVGYIRPLQLTQKELAKRLDVHQPEISNLLTGKLSKVSVRTLIHYGVKLDLGFSGKFIEPKHPPSTPSIQSRARRHAHGAKTKAQTGV